MPEVVQHCFSCEHRVSRARRAAEEGGDTLFVPERPIKTRERSEHQPQRRAA
jgi:hypothetical protein